MPKDMKRKSNITANREIDAYRAAKPGTMTLENYLAVTRKRPANNLRTNTAIKRYSGGKK